MSEQLYYGHGKLLLTGEYFVLDGAKSLALPTKLGQRMYVKCRPSNAPRLYWKSYDSSDSCWLEAQFELWRFDIISPVEPCAKMLMLQNILRMARKQNIHFLRDDIDFFVETKIEFPLNWGLGSSSTLIYNIAQWAYISPYELLANTFKGSGYDIACAQSLGPITFQIQGRGPNWETASFSPSFKDQLYFLYLNKKKNSHADVNEYYKIDLPKKDSIIKRISNITEEILKADDLAHFENLLLEHENIVAMNLNKKRIMDLDFFDFDGVVKSLGAWGGDFALVTSKRSYEQTKNYFSMRGYNTILRFDDLILQNFEKLKSPVSISVLNPINEKNIYVSQI